MTGQSASAVHVSSNLVEQLYAECKSARRDSQGNAQVEQHFHLGAYDAVDLYFLSRIKGDAEDAESASQSLRLFARNVPDPPLDNPSSPTVKRFRFRKPLRLFSKARATQPAIEPPINRLKHLLLDLGALPVADAHEQDILRNAYAYLLTPYLTDRPRRAAMAADGWAAPHQQSHAVGYHQLHAPRVTALLKKALADLLFQATGQLLEMGGIKWELTTPAHERLKHREEESSFPALNSRLHLIRALQMHYTVLAFFDDIATDALLSKFLNVMEALCTVVRFTLDYRKVIRDRGDAALGSLRLKSEQEKSDRDTLKQAAESFVSTLKAVRRTATASRQQWHEHRMDE